jgi:hypothetical protein
MRHGVHLAAHLHFKSSPKLCEQANKATNEHIKRAAQNLAKREKASIHDPAKVKLCASKLFKHMHRQSGHLAML